MVIAEKKDSTGRVEKLVATQDGAVLVVEHPDKPVSGGVFFIRKDQIEQTIAERGLVRV